MNDVAQVQALYRAALHRIAARAAEYESKDNGQGRAIREMAEHELRTADVQAAEVLESIERLRRRR